MPEGKNKARPRKGVGSIATRAINKSGSPVFTGPKKNNVPIFPVLDKAQGRHTTNPGAGPASVADMQAMKRSGHTVRETRKKVKNIKRQVSEKRAHKGAVQGRQPLKMKAGTPRAKHRIRTPGHNPPKKEKR